LAAPASVGTLQQVFNGGGVWGSQSIVGGETDFGWNFYYNGGFKSRLADVASRLSFNSTSGRVSFWTAPSPGSADAALTFTEALRIDATTGVTALVLFSPQQATTAGAPAYVKGAIYFDTTLNKLRVGGATAWETITSV
jgi:hypothetical protein